MENVAGKDVLNCAHGPAAKNIEVAVIAQSVVLHQGTHHGIILRADAGFIVGNIHGEP